MIPNILFYWKRWKTIRLFKCYYGLIGHRLTAKTNSNYVKKCSWIKATPVLRTGSTLQQQIFEKHFLWTMRAGTREATDKHRHYVIIYDVLSCSTRKHHSRLTTNAFTTRISRYAKRDGVQFSNQLCCVCGFKFLSEEIYTFLKVFGKNN